MAAAAIPVEATRTALVPSPMASKLRRLAKARRQEIKKLDIHLHAKHHLQRLGPTTPFTVYSFFIRDETQRRQQDQQRRNTSKKEWVLEKRYSEVYDMKLKLQSLVHMWESTQSARQRRSEPFASLSKVLRKPLHPKFPRKHLRCDSDSIVRERCVGLYAFVRSLFDVYADIYVHLYAQKKSGDATTAAAKSADMNTHLDFEDHRNATDSYHILWGIYLDIVSFLNIPDRRKIDEYRHARAILSLEDCQESGAATAESSWRSDEYSCCICFDEGGPGSDDDTCEEDMLDTSGSSKTNSIRLEGGERKEERNWLVQLPCGHRFHEDCLISWFCASETCPLCRHSVLP